MTDTPMLWSQYVCTLSELEDTHLGVPVHENYYALAEIEVKLNAYVIRHLSARQLSAH